MQKKGVAVFEDNAEAYDRWFDKHDLIYLAELKALQRLMPAGQASIETWLHLQNLTLDCDYIAIRLD